MRRFLFMTILMTMFMVTPVFATSTVPGEDTTNIPEMSFEQFQVMMQAKQGKVDIIKKNNVQITTLKESLKTEILEAAKKVNNLRIDISADKVAIDDATILELKELLEFLQEAKNTLETDAQNISDEINEILDLISTKSMQLDQYDLIIEKQNTIIVRMKEILEMVNKI